MTDDFITNLLIGTCKRVIREYEVCENCENHTKLSDNRLFCPILNNTVDGEDTCNEGVWQ